MKVRTLTCLFVFTAFFQTGKCPAQQPADSTSEVLLRALSMPDGTPKVDSLIVLLDSDLIELAPTEIKKAQTAIGQLSEKLDYVRGTAFNLYYDAIDLTFNQSRYKEGTETFMKALQMLQGTPYKLDIAQVYLSLCEATRGFDAEKSLEYGREAKKLLDEMPLDKGTMGPKIGADYFLARTHRVKKQFPEALALMLEAQQFARQMNSADWIQTIGSGLAEHYIFTGEPEKAIPMLAQLIKDQPLMPNHRMRLSKAHHDLKNYQESIDLMDSAMVVIQNLGGEYDNWLVSAYQTQMENYAALQNFEKAYHFSGLFHARKDTTINNQNRSQLQELQTQYETKEKENALAASTIELDFQKKIGWGLFAGLALLGGLLFWAARLYRARNRAVLDLEKSNATIQAQGERIKLAMRELHHRVKNNLQLVSSLLSIQSLQLQDKTAQKAVKEGQLRIEAMSIIHQKLYQREELTEINLREYVINLTEQVAHSYGFGADDFDLKIEINDTFCDIDQAVPIGLIINELLTNSFKYAFENTDRPALEISLALEPQIHIFMKDNGAGMPAEKPANGTGFGSRLIASLSRQLHADHRFYNDGGACFELKKAA